MRWFNLITSFILRVIIRTSFLWFWLCWKYVEEVKGGAGGLLGSQTYTDVHPFSLPPDRIGIRNWKSVPDKSRVSILSFQLTIIYNGMTNVLLRLSPAQLMSSPSVCDLCPNQTMNGMFTELCLRFLQSLYLWDLCNSDKGSINVLRNEC